MFALPRTGWLGVNVHRARATLSVLLLRGFDGRPGFSSASQSRSPTIANRCRRSFGFTLLELLIVIGIIGLLLVLIAPAFTYMKNASDFTSAVYGIQGALDSARTYAKANHTYVFVGFAEVDVSVDPSVIPQVTTGATPYGRVAVAVVASQDGTLNSNPANLVAIWKLQRYENLHFVVNFGPWIPFNHPLPNSKMARNPPTSTAYILGAAPDSARTFAWPLNSNSAQYQFNKVIYFDPKGVARIDYGTNADEITQVMEIDLQPTYGTLVPPNPSSTQDVGNQAVVQLVPMSGEIHVFRP